MPTKHARDTSSELWLKPDSGSCARNPGGASSGQRLSRRGVLAGLPLAGLLLTSCGMTRRGFDYRYRLTLFADAGGATHTGSSVVHVHEHYEQTIDAGWMTQRATNGEAPTVQLGDGRVVAALLGSDGAPWHSSPTGVLLQVYGIQEPAFSDQESNDVAIDALADARGACALTDKQLPELIGFRRTGDPSSAVLLDPSDLSAGLGPGVRLRSAQIEVTDSPVTTGIERQLPWLGARLRAEAQNPSVLSSDPPGWMIMAQQPNGAAVQVYPSKLKSRAWSLI